MKKIYVFSCNLQNRDRNNDNKWVTSPGNFKCLNQTRVVKSVKYSYLLSMLPTCVQGEIALCKARQLQ